MGIITAQNTINKAVGILQDLLHATWPEADLLIYYNDGVRQIVVKKPDANPVNAVVQLVAGAKQSIPAGGLAMIDITRNMGATGATSGNNITLVDKAVLGAVLTNWTAVTANATVIHWMYDPADPKTFYVYPPQPGTGMGYVEMIYSAVPTAIAIGAAIPIDDGYENALLNFILYRAWLKKQPALAQGYWNLFLSDLGLREKEEDENNPNKKPTKGGTP